MSKIEANITLNLPEEVDAQNVISAIQQLLTSLNSRETSVNVVEVDNPISGNPIHFSKRIGA